MMAFNLAAIMILVVSGEATSTVTSQQVAQQDRGTQKQADALATRALPRTERSPGSGLARADAVGLRWMTVSSATLVARQRPFGGGRGDRAHYRVRTTIDYDGDGHPDVAELVETRRRAGIRVTFGGSPRPADIIFSMPGRWGREQLLPAGRHRLYLAKPELGYSVFLRRGRRDEVYHVGD